MIATWNDDICFWIELIVAHSLRFVFGRQPALLKPVYHNVHRYPANGIPQILGIQTSI